MVCHAFACYIVSNNTPHAELDTGLTARNCSLQIWQMRNIVSDMRFGERGKCENEESTNVGNCSFAIPKCVTMCKNPTFWRFAKKTGEYAYFQKTPFFTSQNQNFTSWEPPKTPFLPLFASFTPKLWKPQNRHFRDFGGMEGYLNNIYLCRLLRLGFGFA